MVRFFKGRLQTLLSTFALIFFCKQNEPVIFFLKVCLIVYKLKNEMRYGVSK
jgi:hypothetical protein